jgi:hypothetical protein
MHERDLDVRRLIVDTQAASAVKAGREHLELARSYLAQCHVEVVHQAVLFESPRGEPG